MEYSKKKPCGNMAQSENVLLDGSDKINTNTPVKLLPNQIEQITQSLKAKQQRRFIAVLASTPNIITVDACRAVACVNLSHLRRMTAGVLAKYGYEARCITPPAPIMNGYGEITGQMLWGLYQLGGDV